MLRVRRETVGKQMRLLEATQRRERELWGTLGRGWYVRKMVEMGELAEERLFEMQDIAVHLGVQGRLAESERLSVECYRLRYSVEPGEPMGDCARLCGALVNGRGLYQTIP
jgi:hypothetical protein